VTVITIGIALFSFSFGIVAGMGSYNSPFLVQWAAYEWKAVCWLIAGAVCDVFVAVPVSLALYTSRTGFKETDRLLKRLIVWVINTGLLTLVLQVAAAVLFIAAQQTLYEFALDIIIAKAYSNSLLASLNRRGTDSFNGDAAPSWSESGPVAQNIKMIALPSKDRAAGFPNERAPAVVDIIAVDVTEEVNLEGV